jgi:hypothetical protein
MKLDLVTNATVVDDTIYRLLAIASLNRCFLYYSEQKYLFLKLFLNKDRLQDLRIQYILLSMFNRQF